MLSFKRVFVFVTFREFATHFELKIVVFWSQCNFSSYYRVLIYLTYKYTLRLNQMYFYFRRYWVFQLRPIQRIFSTSLSNISGLLLIFALPFSSHKCVALLCSKTIYTLCYLKDLWLLGIVLFYTEVFYNFKYIITVFQSIFCSLSHGSIWLQN